MRVVKKDGYLVEYPPNLLAKKVPRSGGPSLEDAETEAERRLARLAVGFPAVVAKSIVTMRAAAHALEVDPTDTAAQRTVFREAHDLKGQAATFGYDLLGRFAACLCMLIESVPDPAARRPDLVAIHIDAMAWAMDHGVRSVEDPLGAAVLAQLERSLG